MFESCMNTEIIEEKGLFPLKTLLDTLGGWPVVKGPTWDSESFKWFKLRDLGFSVNYLVYVGVTVDQRNPSSRVLTIDQPSLGTRREYLVEGLENEKVQVYQFHLFNKHEIMNKSGLLNLHARRC